MLQTPKSLRLQIALFGRTNVGKSSFLNMIANQDVAITSTEPGTTTDVVEKAIELLPIGPVTFLDTGGIDDVSKLAEKRIERTLKILNRADIAVLITEPNEWTIFEDRMVEEFTKANIPMLLAVNKIDNVHPDKDFISKIEIISDNIIYCSSTDIANRDKQILNFKDAIASMLPSDFLKPHPLIGDLIPKGGVAVLITPIDSEAPKGRLILPQVQAIRDVLDNDGISLVVKETEYIYALAQLARKPDLVVCDSQVVLKMVAETPPEIKCTTFSILFSRLKGDIDEEARGVAVIDQLQKNDKILIAEACSHHPLEDDIGRIKIPRWLREYIGEDIQIDFCRGRDFPDNLKEYKLIIHCGGCMLTRNEKLIRMQYAKEAGVPMTNYGITISLVQGVIGRVLSPFPAALQAYLEAAGGK